MYKISWGFQEPRVLILEAPLKLPSPEGRTVSQMSFPLRRKLSGPQMLGWLNALQVQENGPPAVCQGLCGLGAEAAETVRALAHLCTVAGV